MKCVIFAGGRGTRMGEETDSIPKPMVKIGGKPLLWHLMSHYAAFGIKDFIICCGHKGQVIRDYFVDFHLREAEAIQIQTGDETRTVKIFSRDTPKAWTVTCVDTGEDTLTGGRLKRVQGYVGQEDFCCTYGDGLSDVDITSLIAFHKNQKTWATLTAVQPPGRFGAVTIGDGKVQSFHEKPDGDGWMNAGFFVFSPKIFEIIEGDQTQLEKEPMEKLSATGQLSAFRHTGFWHCMDVQRDRDRIEELWQSGAPWRTK